MDGGAFRSALGAFATGVTIVTTRDQDGRDVGLTANSFNSVSLDPPLILWSLAKASGSFVAFSDALHFAVHVLSDAQQDLSNRFAKRGADKFAGLELTRGKGDVPLFEGCSARFQCRPAYTYDGGDHVIFVGEVLDFDQSDRAPLVFHGGKYALAAAPAADAGRGDDLAHLVQRVYFHLLTPVRAERDRLGVTLHDHYVMGVLAGRDGCTLDEINAIVDYTGIRATAMQVEDLIRRGLAARGGERTDTLHLTATGHSAIVSLLAAAKAVEADVGRHLTGQRMTLLKTMLRAALQDSDEGPMSHVSEHMALLEQVRANFAGR